eukprot:3635040-Lingulodinium_polyedra.AAC.1
MFRMRRRIIREPIDVEAVLTKIDKQLQSIRARQPQRVKGRHLFFQDVLTELGQLAGSKEERVPYASRR